MLHRLTKLVNLAGVGGRGLPRPVTAVTAPEPLRRASVGRKGLRRPCEGRSMQDVARQAVRDDIERTSKHELLDAVLDRELPRYAEALERLEQ